MQYPPTNDSTDWDWIIWETCGNPDPRFQRGGTTRKLGLYRLSYHKLRKAGAANWANPHTDHTIGGGWIKVAALQTVDYRQHQDLIDTFLPCFTIDGNGHLVEPAERAVPEQQVVVRRGPRGAVVYNTIEILPPVILMPYNYDDNALNSGAVGTKLRSPLYANEYGALRLQDELDRWATASRSSIAAFESGGVNGTLYPYRANERDDWPFRVEKTNTAQKIDGPAGGVTIRQYQVANPNRRYYSVKTGVQYVGTENQKEPNAKDKLEGNSIHAMTRSNLIAGTMSRHGAGRFEARYQIEVLSILFGQDGQFDGIQIREVGNAAQGEVWFPALAIPSHGRKFVESWAPRQNWKDFWEQNFAHPLGRAKGEMLCYFGLQHMTSNAQNFLIAFDRGSVGSPARFVVLRDIGDTIYNNHFFDVLKATANPTLYRDAWNDEIADRANGLVLGGEIGGGYFNPRMTRIGGTIVFFFGPFRKIDLDTEA